VSKILHTVARYVLSLVARFLRCVATFLLWFPWAEPARSEFAAYAFVMLAVSARISN
jgi:hypothetical protein